MVGLTEVAEPEEPDAFTGAKDRGASIAAGCDDTLECRMVSGVSWRARLLLDEEVTVGD